MPQTPPLALPCPGPAEGPLLPTASAVGAGRSAALAPSKVEGNDDPSDELVLVRRAGAGDTEAFGLLVEQHTRRVYNYVLQMTRHPHDAQDLTQDTFLKAYRALQAGTTPQAWVPWLLTIARRTALNYFRATRPTEPLANMDIADSADTAATVADRDDWDSLWTLARRLKPDLFEVLWLTYAEGLSNREVARVTRRHAVHVRVLLHRARQQLLKRLAPP